MEILIAKAGIPVHKYTFKRTQKKKHKNKIFYELNKDSLPIVYYIDFL